MWHYSCCCFGRFYYNNSKEVLQLVLLLVLCLFAANDVAQAAGGYDHDEDVVDVDVDICIIGAGPAGIQAAYSAEAKGYSIAVFEKNNYIGGKTKTYRGGQEGSDEPYLMGATVHSEGKSNNLSELAKKFNVKPWNGGVTIPEVQVGWYDGSTLVADPTNFISLIPETLLYLYKRSALNQYLNRPDAYLTNYPTELNTMSLREWFVANGMPTIDKIFWQLFTTFGYGNTNDAPAIYGLKYISAEQFLNLLVPLGFSTLRGFPFQELLEKMAASLQGTVHLQANIIKVDYKEDYTIIQYTSESDAPTDKDGIATITCGSTMIAFAPTADNMSGFIPPQSTKLKYLLEEIHINNYYTLLFEDRDSAFDNKISVKYHIPLSFVPDNPALNLVCFKELKIPTSSVVAYYLSPTLKSNQQALKESVAHYEQLIGRSVSVPQQVQDFNYWSDYFPHVSSAALQSGFYHKFDSFQGHYRQYYVGSLFNFEVVQDAMEHADYIIQREF